MATRRLPIDFIAASGTASWLDRDFTRLWAGLSASLVGTQVTGLAIPLIAAIDLHASPFQMGVLAAANQAAYLLVSLPAGLAVDRFRRRPIMVVCDFICALLLLSIPLAWWLGALSFPHLCLATAGVGIAGAIGEIAHMAYVPTLVGKASLVPANVRIQMSHSVAESAGPGLGGILVQLLSAPVAIVADAATYIVSLLLLRRIETVEAPPPRRLERSMRIELGEGFRSLFAHRVLRPVIWTSMASVFFSSGALAQLIAFATLDLNLNAAVLGAVFTLGGLCAIPGSMLAAWSGGRFGVGRSIVWGWIVEATAWLLIPVASGPVAAIVGILALSRAIEGLTGTIANIHQWTLRQVVTPDALQGRVTASHRFLVYGSGALGALAGGALGSWTDMRTAIAICALGALAARLGALFTPLRTYRGECSGGSEHPSTHDDR